MGSSWKRKLSSKLVFSPDVNRVLLQMKRSWDEVEAILKGVKKKGKKPC